MEKEDYLKKWIEGTLTEEEKRDFETSDMQRSLEKLTHALPLFKAPEYDDQAEYERLKKRCVEKRPAKTMPLYRFGLLLKIAAVLVLTAGSYFFFLSDSSTEVKTLAAEKKELTLPDQSFVALNALSLISFNKKEWSSLREVHLEGEAYFKVIKGSRFDVKTTAGTVTVLGTQFNVKSRAGYFEVTCYEGSVKVSAGQEAILRPGDSFRMMNGVSNVGPVEVTSPDWRANESAFRSLPFSYVLQEFERQFNVTVTTKSVDTSQRFTGSFSHADMTLALQSISIPMNLSYEIVDEKHIVLKGDSQ